MKSIINILNFLIYSFNHLISPANFSVGANIELNNHGQSSLVAACLWSDRTEIEINIPSFHQQWSYKQRNLFLYKKKNDFPTFCQPVGHNSQQKEGEEFQI